MSERRERAMRELSDAERNGAALLRVGYDPNCLLCYDDMHEGARTDRRKYVPPHVVTGMFIPRDKKAEPLTIRYRKWAAERSENVKGERHERADRGRDSGSHRERHGRP